MFLSPLQLVIVGLYAAIIGLIVLVFFTDVDEESWKGAIARFTVETVPTRINGGIRTCLGEKAAMGAVQCCDWVINQRNPLLQILYHVILFGAFQAWLWYGEPLLPTHLVKTPPHSKYEAHVGIALCLFSWVMANFTPPGKITKENLTCYSHNHYDQLIFTDDVICSTCNIQKPARSKHCSLCGYCVPMFDHHCIWLNQCVGEHNFKYFLLFLVVHSAVFLYFGYLLTLILISPIVQHRMWEMSFVDPHTGQHWTGWGLTFNYLLNNSTALIILSFMAVLFGLCLLGFLGYHLYLIKTGQTTNESFKWSSCYRLHKQLKECHQNYVDAVAQGVEFVMQDVNEGEDGYEEGEGEDGRLPSGDLTADVDGPLTADVRSESKEGEGPPVDRHGANKAASMPDRRHFLRQMVEQDEIPYYLVVDPGDLPRNTYNKGFTKNLLRAVFPPSEPLLRELARKKKEETRIAVNEEKGWKSEEREKEGAILGFDAKGGARKRSGKGGGKNGKGKGKGRGK